MKMESNTPILVTLTGPSCSGKSTLEAMLKERGFASVVSVTTRKPRAGEVDGQHYHFLSEATFVDMADSGEMVEHVEFNGNRYGVTKTEMNRVAASGKPIVVVVEPHGAWQYRRFAAEAKWKLLSLFVNNPAEVLAKRFLDRFQQEIEAGNCKAIESYPARLALMMTEERNWVRNNFEDGYDFTFDRFDDDSTWPIVNFIVAHVEALRDLASAKEAA
jgi:guanylate kinase